MTPLRILPAKDIDFASTVSRQITISGAGKAGDAYPNDSAASPASQISAVGATNEPGPQKASVITGEEPRNGNRPEGNGGELRAMITADSTSCEGNNGLQPNGPHASDSLSNHAGTSGVPPAGSVNLGRPPATPDGMTAGLSKIEQAAQELDDAIFLLWPGKSEAAQRVIKAIKLIKEAKDIMQ